MVARCLTIAASDSGGGAGIQADLRAFAAAGCYGTSVIVALTAQNTVGIAAIHEVPTAFIAAQMTAVLDDIGADAVKTGALLTAAIVETVADGSQGALFPSSSIRSQPPPPAGACSMTTRWMLWSGCCFRWRPW